MLDRRVLDWHDCWCDYDSEIEPGDLEGEPMLDDRDTIAASL